MKRLSVHRQSLLGPLVVAVLLIAGIGADAAYLKDVPQTLTQPDGSEVSLLATGDERYHWLHDQDGYVVVRDPKSGWFVYADKAEGRLVPTGLVAGKSDPRKAGLEPGLKPDPKIIRQRFTQLPSQLDTGKSQTKRANDYTEINNLVIFVRFADDSDYSSIRPLSVYEETYNDNASGASSMHAYYKEVSYQQLTINSHFFPEQPGGRIVSYQDSQPRSYLQPHNENSNPNGYSSEGFEGIQREQEVLVRALNSIADLVPGDLDLDNNGDGYIDNLTFFIKGYPEGWNDQIWPHQSRFYWQFPTINSAKAGRYNLLTEHGYVYPIAGQLLGVVCHEMGHTLGAPDLYHYSNCSSNDELTPVGPWDLMHAAIDLPQHIGAHLKSKYIGWISEIPEITASGSYSLSPLIESSNNAYRVASPNSEDEYFVLEYRSQDGVFDGQLPGSGLLVYRVVPSLFGNSCGPPDEVYLFRPNGTLDRNGTIDDAYFSGQSGRTELSESSASSPFLSRGETAGISVTNIGNAGSTISFSVNLDDPCLGRFDILAPTDSGFVTGDSATLQWTAATGASSYDVYFGTEQDPPLLQSTTATSLTVNGLDSGPHYWRVMAGSGSCLVSSTTHGALTFFVNPDIVDLENGVTIPNISSSVVGHWTYYRLEVPSDVTRMTFQTIGGTGDLDLYVKWNGLPTSTDYHEGSGNWDSNEMVIFIDPPAGTYYAGVYTYSAYSGSSIIGEYEVNPPPVINAAGDYVYVVPAAAHATGLEGTSWVSDLVVHSLTDNDSANLFFVGQGENGLDTEGVRLQLVQEGSLSLPDVVWQTFEQDPAGGSLLVGSDQPLIVSSRTYNNAPTGTYGQYIPGFPVEMAYSQADEVRLIQLTRNDDFRTNIGFANAAGVRLDVKVMFYQADGSYIRQRTYSIPPYGYLQASDVINKDADDAFAVVTATSSDARYFCYASVIDNRTGDPILVTQPVIDAGTTIYLLASAQASGIGGTEWRTDVELHSTGDNPVTCQIELLKHKRDNSAPESVEVAVPAGESVRLEGILDTQFGFSGTAALRLTTVGGGLLVTNRTYNQTPEGTYGQFIAGVTDDAAIAYQEEATLVQLSYSADSEAGYRTNIGFVNAGATEITVEVDLRDASGNLIGNLSYTLRAFEYKQISDIFSRVTNQDVPVGVAVVRTTTEGGSFFAYASVVDNRSGDPIYIAARPDTVSAR
jgi:M6 family metalloprotease-like protein